MYLFCKFLSVKNCYSSRVLAEHEVEFTFRWSFIRSHLWIDKEVGSEHKPKQLFHFHLPKNRMSLYWINFIFLLSSFYKLITQKECFTLLQFQRSVYIRIDKASKGSLQNTVTEYKYRRRVQRQRTCLTCLESSASHTFPPLPIKGYDCLNIKYFQLFMTSDIQS